MRDIEKVTSVRRRSAEFSARSMPGRTPAEETLARSRAERAQLEQGRIFQADLIEEAEQLHEEIRLLHEELREVFRQLSNLRRRFTSLPPAPRLVGFQPIAVPPQLGAASAGTAGRATA